MPRLTFTSGPREGKAYNVPVEGLTLGRDFTSDLQLDDTKVSGRHAMVRFDNGRWWIYDLESSNGTRLNGESARAGSLASGDTIRVGDCAMVFEFEAGEEEPGGPPVIEATEPKSVSLRQESGKGKGAKTGPAPGGTTPASDTALVGELNRAYKQMREQLAQVIVGQDQVIEQMLIAIFCRGHALLMGVPGLAKTLLVSTLSHVLDLSFKRIQFTPDLMPADITGTEVLEEDPTTGSRRFRFVKGPIFANMVLADEINRTPPKTQAALLEAMQEHHVTVGDQTWHLPEPFFVLATQNPIEQEGTYPLPEAQLDRFMFNIIVDYPTAQEEVQIIRQVTGSHEAKVEVALGADDVLKLQQVVRRVPVADHVIAYAAVLARATRPKSTDAPQFVREMVGWGAGPRAGINLITAAKARAILQGRFHCTTADVIAMAAPVLRHRVLTTFTAEAAGVTSDEIIRMLLDHFKPGSDIDV